MEGCCPFYLWFCVFCFGVSKAVVGVISGVICGGILCCRILCWEYHEGIGPDWNGVFFFGNREEPFFIHILGTPHEISCWSIEVAGN